jgi:type I restriction enzyme M protein
LRELTGQLKKLILHDINYEKFDIKQSGTAHAPVLRTEPMVANPSFSAKWSANTLHLRDDHSS